MKYFLCLILLLILFSPVLTGQENQYDSTKVYAVIKNDGSVYVGIIKSEDAREVLIKTTSIGLVYIPKHEIRSIAEIVPGDLNRHGEYIPPEVYSTRYFFTTNTLPLDRGDNHLVYNTYGPDYQYQIGNSFSLRATTSWVGIPSVGSAKYTINLQPGINLGFGAVAATGSYSLPDVGLVMPFSSITFGDQRGNFTASVGYVYLFTEEEKFSRGIISLGAMKKGVRKVSLIFDSFYVLPGPIKQVPRQGYNVITNTSYIYYESVRDPGFGIVIPGLRWQTGTKKAFQFGIAAISYDKIFLPFPFPIIQWFRQF